MEAHHASLGRRTLEEIRQKRATERLSKTSSGPDLAKQLDDSKSESSTRISETDIGGLVSQIRDLELNNSDLDRRNRQLLSMLQTVEAENDARTRRLNDLENNTVPSLRKALKDVAMEKDAAVVAREDFSAQLRLLKKRVKDAEEDQYRAEEDAASLRAELNSIQRQSVSGSFTSPVPYQMETLEKELATLKLELQQESVLRRQEQQRLAEEQAQTRMLVSQKQELEDRLAAAMSKITVSSDESHKVAEQVFKLEDKEKLEKQLHDMAVVVERLESSRQKLLVEIDSQSSEIERLFEENSRLSSSYQEVRGMAIQWENQVKDCLKHNEELRGVIDTMRSDQVKAYSTEAHNGGGAIQAGGSSAEIISLKGQVANEQSRAEALSAHVLQLSAQLQQATQAYSSLARLYQPVLRNIESSLIRMKQDGPVTVQ